MERVLYLLGAGFSAPLGIPVVNNFVEKSKDLYFTDPKRFAHFQQVFETIRELAVCKNYYSTDLHNIENILSLLEMKTNVAGEQDAKKRLVKYIADVIGECTPELQEPPTGIHWADSVFGPKPWNRYGTFAATFLECRFGQFTDSENPNRKIYRPVNATERTTEYSIITLNYDLVIENIASALNQRLDTHFEFRTKFDGNEQGVFHGYLAKLHGSINGRIVPPTWNKTLTDQNILTAWQTAHTLLANTNHLRIVGYSLPTADNYIKYLLREAVVSNPHLKSLDVLCLDDRERTVQRRYEEFITFPKLRFVSENVTEYLSENMSKYGSWPVDVRFDKLEAAHENFYQSRLKA